MSPVGGITALLCLLIILIQKSYEIFNRLYSITVPNSVMRAFEYNRRAISVVIVASITTFVFASGFYIIYRAVQSDTSNIVYIESVFVDETCVPFATTNSTEDTTIVLRLDDVQANAWSKISMRMMEDAFTKNYPVVAGVIPLNITNDQTLMRFLKKNECKLQVAIHGYTHAESEYDEMSAGEFAILDEITATTKILNARQALTKFSGETLTTFIPPQNQISTDARRALMAHGITAISSIGTGPFDIDTATWDFNTMQFVPPETVMTNCSIKFEAGDDVCVIMLHPQDYAQADGTINEENYVQYIKLLEYIGAYDVAVKTFDELIADRGGL